MYVQLRMCSCVRARVRGPLQGLALVLLLGVTWVFRRRFKWVAMLATRYVSFEVWTVLVGKY